jgi:putative ABC transport system permease protein
MDWRARVRQELASATGIPDDDVIEELAQHAHALYEAARADGLSDEAANRRVREQLDRWRLDVTALQRKSRPGTIVEPPPAVSTSSFNGLAHDVRYAARLLRRQPRYALLVSVTMALGIGATTTLFSVAYGVLMKPLPWSNADRLVVLEETRGGRRPRFGSFSNAAYLAWREQATTIEEIGAWSQRTATLAGAGDPERIRITAASASLFAVLGARPLIGSLFGPDDEVPKDGHVIVLAESLWRRRFGADPGALGRAVRLDGQPYRVIGVLPDTQSYPDRQTRAWVPFRIAPATGNLLSMFSAVARLRPDATAAHAAAEGTARGRFAADTGMTTMAIFGSSGPIEVMARPVRETLTAEVRRPLVILLAAVGLLLLTATANVANLQLARATSRYRELATRAALGAGSARITRQLLVESLLLGLAGGAGGLGLAWFLHGLMPSVLPTDFPRGDDVHVDTIVIGFALLVSVSTSVIFGMLPALRVRKMNLVEALALDGTTSVGAGRRSPAARARMAIMAGQVAIACVLLIGASLLGQSFVALLHADRGYDPSGVLTARLSLPSAMYTPERRYALLGRILDRLETVPSVRAVAFTSELPLTPGGSTSAFSMRAPDGATITAQASPRIVGPHYFSALGLRITAGRGFSESDIETSEAVVVVNRSFVRQYLGESPLGSKLPMGAGHQSEHTDATVVGVVDDVRYLTGGASSLPEIYYSYRQFKGRLTVSVVTLLVRASGDPSALASVVRGAVREADDDLVPDALTTMENRLLTSLARPRLYATLVGGFAAFALLVAAVGLFGVLSYTVAQRSREFAVRTALGARQLDIGRLVLGQGLAVTGAGLVAGLLGSIVLTRWLGALLYGVTVHDPMTFLIVPIALIFVAAVASLAPALRAARLDPLRALRSS